MHTPTLTRLAYHQLQLLDALGRAMLVATADGAVYQTVNLERCLAREPAWARQRLERAIVGLADRMVRARQRRAGARVMARQGGRPCAATRQVRTARSRYRLHAVLLAPGVLNGERGAVIVDVEVAARAPLSGMELRARFGLTQREVEVAELMARGLTDAGIAAQLRISRRTAEHHAEHVRRKLGLTGRAAVSAVVFAASGRSGALARVRARADSGPVSDLQQAARRSPRARRSHGAPALTHRARATQRRRSRADNATRL
ncbi:MAG TPA: helix-turn-helix transcriptional regulator [Gemmatimonadales bacterium]|nr:helix-turn-helix transcriptional regulator [Gemmatimonadales bacterium]